jgi:hypothetical protein
VLPHGAPCLGADVRHRELATAFHDRQPLGHGFPRLGGMTELCQVGIAALDITEVDTGAGAEQLQGQVRWGMLEGHDDHRDVLRCRCSDLQRQRRFAHARRSSQQVQPFVEAT